MVNIVVVIEGGLVRDVLAYGPEVAMVGDAEVIDFDTEGMTPQEEADYFEGRSVVQLESGEYELNVPDDAKTIY